MRVMTEGVCRFDFVIFLIHNFIALFFFNIFGKFHLKISAVMQLLFFFSAALATKCAFWRVCTVLTVPKFPQESFISYKIVKRLAPGHGNFPCSNKSASDSKMR